MPRRFTLLHGWLGNACCVGAEVRQIEVGDELAAVRVRVRAHAPIALRSEGGELRHQPAALVEDLLGLIPAHPLLEHRQVIGIRLDVAEWHLVCTESPLDGQAVDDLRSRPSFGRAQDDRGPCRSLDEALCARVGLDAADAREAGVQRGGERRMHGHRVTALDEVDFVAV